jgi:hypothetical protein
LGYEFFAMAGELPSPPPPYWDHDLDTNARPTCAGGDNASWAARTLLRCTSMSLPRYPGHGKGSSRQSSILSRKSKKSRNERHAGANPGIDDHRRPRSPGRTTSLRTNDQPSIDLAVSLVPDSIQGCGIDSVNLVGQPQTTRGSQVSSFSATKTSRLRQILSRWLRTRSFYGSAIQPGIQSGPQNGFHQPASIETLGHADRIAIILLESRSGQLSAEDICKRIMRLDHEYKKQRHSGWQVSLPH